MSKRSWIYGLVLTTTCLPALLCAQESGKRSAPEWASKQFNLQFPGGTLAEFVDVLRKEVPELNVVVAEDIQDVPIQSLTLNNVVAVSALATVEELLEPQIELGPVTGPIEATTPVILLRQNTSRLRTAAFSTKKITEKDGAQNLVEEIEFAIESLPNHDRRQSPKVRLHEKSGIMIVTADQDQLRLIAQVVELLGGESRVAFGSGLGGASAGYNAMGSESGYGVFSGLSGEMSGVERGGAGFEYSNAGGGAPSKSRSLMNR